MKQADIRVMAIVSLALGGCQGAMWANTAALVVTVGLFLGTVQMRRPTKGSATSTHGASATSTQQS